jgi:agmatinase
MRIVKVPRINALGKKGPEKAPNLILEELKKNYGGFSSLDLEEIHVDNGDVKESHDLIYKNAKEEFEKGKGVLFVGGDHSISAPILKGFGDVYGFEDSFLIVFDAHADAMLPLEEPTHEEILRSAIEYGFKPENVVLVGVRKIEPEEMKFLKENNVKVFSEIYDLEAVGDYITEKAKDKNVYLSVDMDVLDPAFAPGVNVPEPLGMTSKDLFYLLRRAFHLPNLKGIDVVEAVPDIDKKYDFRTVKLASKILEDFLKIVK